MSPSIEIPSLASMQQALNSPWSVLGKHHLSTVYPSCACISKLIEHKIRKKVTTYFSISYYIQFFQTLGLDLDSISYNVHPCASSIIKTNNISVTVHSYSCGTLILL